ncbi:hypothetical protein GCM10009720_22900 [Yaniella flava]|uniref:Nuclease PIN n=1 Tax=Yaniella flava TaxID=287930 RepID=A0ABN2UQB8_9MICC|nr:hypothetical protein [Micrococcaceae bacterium]
MKLSVTRLFSADESGAAHVRTLAKLLVESVDLVTQMFGASPETGTELDAQLDNINAQASKSQATMLTALRSSYLTPLPREDLYLLGTWINRAIEAVSVTGTIIHATRQYRLPSRVGDVLEILTRQADLVLGATEQLTQADDLESTWMHLERLTHQAQRALATWRLADADELLARHYYRQQEVARSLESTFMTLREFSTQLGRILVRDS